ncbi:MAG: tetratricopeptide repeat protein [Nitrospirota bacterium]
MSLKDIEKLKEKVDKDPNSKLFVPLADEYRKEGMLDEAINVLLNGLEKQPVYSSARVALGKIYIEKGMLEEARNEFEKVIKSIPDNLYAHKKLAEIYKDTGERELAIRSFKTVLKLNPMDEDALNKLREIEGLASDEKPPEQPQRIEPFPDEGVEPSEEAVEAEDFAGKLEAHIFTEKPAVEPPHAEEDLDAFKESIFGSQENETEGFTEEISLEDDKDSGADEDIGILDEPSESGEDITVDKIEDVTPEEIETEFLRDTENLEIKEPAAKNLTVEDADICISKGDYVEAMNVLRNILSSNPDDRKVLQRAEELKVLLKLMGKDKEVLISKLNSFLEGINKRRDEFFRSS